MIRFQQSQALTSHFVSFWSRVKCDFLREIDFTEKLLKCLLFCRLSKGSFYMPKRLDLWSSTILSWLPIWLIVSLYLKVPLVSTLELVLLNRCSLVWTSSLSNYKSHSEGIHRIIGTFWIINFSNLNNYLIFIQISLTGQESTNWILWKIQNKKLVETTSSLKTNKLRFLYNLSMSIKKQPRSQYQDSEDCNYWIEWILSQSKVNNVFQFFFTMIVLFRNLTSGLCIY